MALKKIRFENPHTGASREAPVGFSWTVFLFGFFPPLIRGDWKWFAVVLISASMSLGLSNFVFCFIYNKLYIKDLINSGYKATYVDSGDINSASVIIGLKIPKSNNFQKDSKETGVESVKSKTPERLNKLLKKLSETNLELDFKKLQHPLLIWLFSWLPGIFVGVVFLFVLLAVTSIVENIERWFGYFFASSIGVTLIIHLHTYRTSRNKRDSRKEILLKEKTDILSKVELEFPDFVKNYTGTDSLSEFRE